MLFIELRVFLAVKVSRRAFILSALVGGLGLLLTDSLFYEPRVHVSLEYLDVVLNGLGEDFTIGHISDIHLGSPSPIWRALNVLKDGNPDVIVVTGDIFSKQDRLEEGLEVVGRLIEIAPTYLVYGNWDYWSNVDLDEFKRKAENIGAVILRNEWVRLEYGVYLIGVDDPYTGRDRLEEAMVGCKGPKVLLAHSPQIIGKAEGRVNLILSGHTHGGQVVIPGLGPLYVPLPGKYRKYCSGLYTVGETLMYVNRGIGISVFPIRFACPPEVTLVRLTPPLL